MSPSERPHHVDVLARMQAALPDEGFAREWLAGRALSFEEALRLATRSEPLLK